ncbi:hypothetical protein TCAL_11940 [Tigriopus californicus]|uniref:Nephrin n=1 Tax=Tigriopus californicus TaxID=6832 RepID=A0A553P1J9_TIGCA|nr:hypothetical protein TCAL_11940 [Tigriopus californicus]
MNNSRKVIMGSLRNMTPSGAWSKEEQSPSSSTSSSLSSSTIFPSITTVTKKEVVAPQEGSLLIPPLEAMLRTPSESSHSYRGRLPRENHDSSKTQCFLNKQISPRLDSALRATIRSQKTDVFRRAQVKTTSPGPRSSPRGHEGGNRCRNQLTDFQAKLLPNSGTIERQSRYSRRRLKPRVTLHNWRVLLYAALVGVLLSHLGAAEILDGSRGVHRDSGGSGDDMQEVYSVVSGSAHIPCNITGTSIDDGARLVLWYKDDDPQPVYSFDARFSTVKHWSEDPHFGPRTFFRDSSDPAQLIISSVEMDDMGVYKCRVDFRESPTVITKVKLNIVEEPKKPVILDDEGSAVMGNIGPFRLKKPLILVCIVEGGNPLPEVSWWRDGQMFDQEGDPSTYEDVLQNTLVISALDRTFHDSLFECRAINNNVTEPPTSSVSIKLELPILEISLSNLPDPVTADVRYDVLCQVIGAQPPPTITWRLGEIMNDIDPSNIREGDDIVLKCNIQAHPWVWRILWYKDGEEMVSSDRVVIDEQRLVLKNASKSFSGQFVCSASKVEGDGFSKPMMITVNYKPVCLAPTIEYKGNNRSQGIDLKCQVDAKPKSSTFRWLFNSSETRFEIPSAESIMSFGNYKPTSGDQHGEVLCWASNDLGEQLKPCVFHVVPLGAPQAPRDCQISNHSASTIEVTCTPGFSGGLSQHFVMEVFETLPNNSQVLIASNWTEDSTISVWGLVPESNYIISVKAVNEKGESSPVYVGGKTEGFIQSLPRAVEESRLPLLFVIVGILLAMMVLGACVTATVACKRRRHKMSADSSYDTRNGSPLSVDDDIEPVGDLLETSQPLMDEHHVIQNATIQMASTPLNNQRSHTPPERKVSFRDCTYCQCGNRVSSRRLATSNGDLHRNHRLGNGNSSMLPIERAVVRTFSIDKMRPICHVCNPGGETPYPPDHQFEELDQTSQAMLNMLNTG